MEDRTKAIAEALDICSKIHTGEIPLDKHGKPDHYQTFLDAADVDGPLASYSSLLWDHIHEEHNFQDQVKWPDLDNCATCQAMTLEFFNIAYQYYIWDLTGVFDEAS